VSQFLSHVRSVLEHFGPKYEVSGHFGPKSTRHLGLIFQYIFFCYYQHILVNKSCICEVKHESGDAGGKRRLGGVANY